MAANKMQFQYEITANTSQAKKALADLDKALDRLNKQQKMDMGLSQELTEAADAARLLQRELNAAMDVKTGKLNVSELARGLAQAGSSVEQLSTKFLNAGAMGEAAFRGLAQSIVAADVPIKKMNKTLSDAMTTLKNTVKWEMSSTLVHGLEGAFSGAISYAKNLNTSLTNIRIVTGQTVDDMVRFTKEANVAAKQLSTTTKAYADASLIYYQQGDSQELAAKKAAITIKAANSSFETSAKEMSEYLTSVWNSYQVGADELERYVDIMANLGAKTATSLEEIATSMQKVAATANTVGVSMEQVSSIIATVSSVTRESAESIGTSYKTIFARIGDLKLGKVDEDGVGLGQVSSQLDAIGVKILDETGNLREMGDIIMDLGTKWQTMNQAQKTAVAQVVAGKRQYTQLMALFENWNMFQSNMNIAENSEGALQDMADIYAESWEAASARVQASMEGIFNKIINDQGIIKVTNTMADLIGGIENVIDGFGGLGGVITSIGSIATAVFKDKITVGVNDMVKSVTDFKKSFEGKKGKDIFTSFFGESSALRDYKKNLTELQNELKERQGWKGQSETDLFVNESIQKVLQAKQKLLDIEGQLTTAERQRYQASIDNVNTSINDIKEQSMAYDSQIKSIEKLIKQQSSLEAQQEALHRVDPEQTISTKQVQGEMRKKISSLTNAQMLSFNMKNILPNISQDSADIKQLLSRFKELNIIMTAAGEASEGLKDISKHLKTDTVDEQVKKLISTLENFRTILKSIGANTDSIDKILGDLSTGTNDLQKVEQALKEAENATTQYEGAGKRAGAAAKVLARDLGVSSAALDEITEQSKQSASMFRRLSASMKEAANSADEMLKGEGGPGSIGEKFSSLIQGLSSATSAFNTWSNVTANWDGMSLTETLGTVAELALDVATSGSLAGAAMTIAGAAIGGALGYIEKQQKDALEKVQKINEQVTETVEDIKQSNDLANETMRTFEEAERARKNGEIGTEEYLSIVDSVLEAIGAEQLKVQALMGDYNKLADSIRNANNERLAGNKTEARNNRILAYEGLETALKSYEGKGVRNKYEIGRNSIEVDDTELYTLPKDQRLSVKEYLTNMGFQWLDTEKGINLKWQGEETDLPLLFSEWERFENEDFIDNIGTIYSYLTEYMKQFDSYKMAYEAERSLQTEEVLQGYQFNESTLKNQITQGENLFQYIFNNVLTSLKLDPGSISQYDTDIITAQIQDWIKYQADEIQIAFAQGWEAYNNGEEISTRTEQFTDKQFIQPWSSNKGKRSSARYYAQSSYDENIYEERINADQEQSIQDYADAITAYKTATSGTANVSNLITSLLGSSIINIEDIITQQLGDIPEDTNIVDYVSSSSAEIQYLLLEKIIEALGNSILGEDGLQTEALNLQEPLQNIIDQKMAEINNMFSNETGLYDLDVGQYLYNNPEFLEEIKQNYNKDQQKFDEYWVASLSDQEHQIVTALTDNQTFLTDQVLNSNSWLYTLLKDISLLYKDIEIVTTDFSVPKKSNADYGRLSSVGSDYTEWNDSQKAIWNQYANLYTDDADPMRNTALWGAMSEKDITAGIARIQQAAFNKKYSDTNKHNINNAEYVADLAKLDEYVQAATNTSLEEIDNRYDIINSLLSSIQSMDLSKPITDMVIPAEKFQKIMGMSMDEFNQLPSISQKQLALLTAQSTQTAKQAEEIRTAAHLWYDTTGKTLIERGDSEAIVLWAQLTEQIARSQADAATSAQDVKNAYDQINADKIAQITAAAQKQQEEWNKVTNAVNNALSLIKQMSSGDISFSNIEQLKHSLIEAGIETEKVIELIENIENAGNNKEQIKASMVAASQAALAKIGALEEQKQQYKGLITEVDTSQVEPVPMDANATVEEVDDQKLKDVKTNFESDPITPTFSDPTGKEEVVKEVESWGQGKTIIYTDAVTGEQAIGIIEGFGDDQTLIFTTANGDQVKASIKSLGDGQSLTFTTANGEQVKAIIEGFGDDQSLIFTTADGNQIKAPIKSFGDGQSLIFTTANGEQVKATIEGFGNGQSLTFITANGDTVKATIEGFGDSQKLVYTSVETGEIVKTDIQGIGSSQTIKFTSAEIDSGSEVTATIASFGGEQKLIYTTVDGTAVEASIDSIGSDGTITFTKVGDGGETFTAQITAIGQGQELEFTTINDGSEAFKAALANLGKGQTLEFTTVGANGEEFIAQVESIGKGQTITFTNANGDTVIQEIAGWTFTNQGLSIDLVNTAESDVKTTISGWTGFTNNNLLIYPSATAESGLQGALNKMKLEAIIDLKFNGMDSLFQTMLSNQSSKLKSSEITQLAEMYSLPFEQALQQVLDTTQDSAWDAFWSASDLGDATWGSNNAMATFMTHSVNEIRNMSPEVAATMQNEIAKILDIVTKGMKSDDENTKELAAFLYEGLASGLSDCSNIDWSSVLSNAGLSEEIVTAFCVALQIHSPSELTIPLGQYLFDGLKVGIAEADANFTLDPLKGVQNVVSNAFKTAVSNALKDGKITDEEFAQLNFSDSLKGHLQNISQMEGKTIQNKIANYVQKIGDDAVNAYEEQHPDATVAQLAAQAQIAIQKFWDDFNIAITESTTKWTEDYFKNKRWNDDSSLSFNQKAIINEALDAVLEDNGVDSIEAAVANMANGYSDLLAAIQNKINNMGKTVEFELDDTWAEIKDIWKDGLLSIYGEETQAAEDTYNLWESTFKAIVKARQGLLEGKSVMESLVGDKDGLADLYLMYLNQGKTIAEIEELFKDKKAQIDFQDWDFENYDKSGKQRFLNRDNNNQYTDTTLTDYNTNVRNYVNDVLAKELADVVGETFNQESLDKIMSSGSEEMKKAIAVLAQQKEFIEETDTGYKVKENISTDSLVQEILDAVAQSLYATDYAQVNSLLAMARATQVDGQNRIADSVRVEGESVVAEMDTNEQLLLKASGLLREGKTLEYNLEPTELEKLKELTGKSDIAAIGLETLDTASANLTSTMIKATEQLAIAMGMIQRGEATSAQINPETGKVTATKDISYADLIADADKRKEYGITNKQLQGMRDEIQAEMAKRGWQYDNRSGYSRQDESIKYGATAEEDITAIAENLKYSKEVELSGEAASLEGTELEDIHLKNLERQQELLKQNAEAVGMTADEFAQYAQTIEDADTSSNLNNETLYDTARLAKLAEEGWEGLTESQKDNIKTLKKGEKGSKEYKDSLESLTEDVKKVFGNSNKVTEDFVEEHLDEIEKMVDGSVEAGEAIEKALLMEDLGDDYTMPINFDVNSDGAIDQLDTLGDFLNSFGDEFANKPVGFTIEADDSQAIQALNELLASGAMTADQMNSLLATIGWIPEIEEETVEGYGSGDATVSGEIVGSGLAEGAEGSIEGEVHSEQSGDITIPTIKSVTKTGGGGRSAVGKKPSGSSGGGGSSKSKTKKDKKRARDEIERYHVNNKTLESIGKELEKLDKIKDRAYGADHIKALDAETAALQRELEAQQALKKEAEDYMASDKLEFAKYGAKFDADGVITNWDDVRQAALDEYNAAVEAFNNSEQTDEDTAAFEEAEQKYEDIIDSIEKYEEAVNTAKDAANEMLEIQNRMSELELEKITYKLELELDLSDTELDIIDYYKNKYEDALKDQDEYFEKLLAAQSVYEDNLISLEEAKNELETKYRLGLINDADYAEGMEEIQSQMLENLNNIEDLKDEINEAYGNTLDMAREDITEITDLIDGNISSLQSYMTILQLSGREKDYESLRQMYDALYENNLAKININRAHLDALLAEEQALLDKYKDGNQEMSEDDKERHRVLQQQIQETQATLYDATEQTLETLREGFEIMIQSIGEDLDEFMSGAATSLSHLQEQYDYYTETQERYVSAAKELYEVSKLNRDIENSLTTATSSAAKEALKALQEKINKQSELNELTEYDIEMNQLQYQLLLARIKLEESQNAKDTVRLTRDADGNYFYRYTANQDKIDEAAQHYEDILQQINDTTVQRTQEIEAQIVNTMQNYKEKLMEISTDYSLTEEERLLRLEELNAQYAETMRYLQEQNNIAVQNLADNQSAIADHYGVNITSITQSTAGNVNESVQSMIDKAEDYIAAMNDAIYGEEGILAQWEEYQRRIEEVNENSGTSYEQLREDIEKTTENLEDFKDEALEVINTLEDTLDSIAELTEAWDEHADELDNIIDKYENIVELIQRTRDAMNSFGGSNSTGSGNGDGGSNRGTAYATGGLADYTGLAWLDGTPEKPELVLNPDDTENLISAVETVRSLDSGILSSLVNSVKNSAAAMMNMFSNAYHAAGVVFNKNDDSTELTQDIHITAEFPSVTDRNEIEEAILGLANRATQFANRKK